MPKMKKYQLTHFCPNDQAIANHLKNYLLNVGLNLKIFGEPLERLIFRLPNIKIENTSTVDNKQDPNKDIKFFLRAKTLSFF